MVKAPTLQHLAMSLLGKCLPIFTQRLGQFLPILLGKIADILSSWLMTVFALEFSNLATDFLLDSGVGFDGSLDNIHFLLTEPLRFCFCVVFRAIVLLKKEIFYSVPDLCQAGAVFPTGFI